MGWVVWIQLGIVWKRGLWLNFRKWKYRKILKRLSKIKKESLFLENLSHDTDKQIYENYEL